MATLKCKMCGGDLKVESGVSVCECDYCGTKQTIPNIDNEKKLSLFQRANRLRFNCEFDKAAGVYESIITEFPEEAEAYWGLVLCRYGIDYVDDPVSGVKVPTCHRSSFDSVLGDRDFEMVMEYSDPVSRAVYRDEAKIIEQLRLNIIDVSSKEEPYDIFICYKETDDKGERTIDSVLAQDLYNELTEHGYKVFFSRISLEDKLGEEYEPYIFAALNSAKIMLAIGTDYEYYNAVWVKNEWSRFLSLIERGQKKTLIPCYKNLDAYDMPTEFKKLQAQDLGKVGATQDLIRGIEKILGSNRVIAKEQNYNIESQSGTNPEADALIKRGKIAIEDGDYIEAENCFDRALDKDPTDGRAYLGKFMAKNEISSFVNLGNRVLNLDESREFKRAEQFANPTLKKELEKIRKANAQKQLTIVLAQKEIKDKKQINEKEETIIVRNPEQNNRISEFKEEPHSFRNGFLLSLIPFFATLLAAAPFGSPLFILAAFLAFLFYGIHGLVCGRSKNAEKKSKANSFYIAFMLSMVLILIAFKMVEGIIDDSTSKKDDTSKAVEVETPKATSTPKPTLKPTPSPTPISTPTQENEYIYDDEDDEDEYEGYYQKGRELGEDVKEFLDGINW